MICMSNVINSLGLREKTLVCDADAFHRLPEYNGCTEQQVSYIAYSCVYNMFEEIRAKLSECNLPEPIWMEPPRIEEKIVTTSGEVSEIPFIPTSEKGCVSGCLMSNGVCVPFGTRAEGQYCGISKQFLAQKEIDGACENSYECKSNECSNGKCISTYGLLEQILNFLKNLF